MGDTVHMVHPEAFNGRFSSGEAVLPVIDGNLDCPSELLPAALAAGFRPGPGRVPPAVLEGSVSDANPLAGPSRETADLGTMAPVPVAGIVGDDDAGFVVPAVPDALPPDDALPPSPAGITTETGLTSAPRGEVRPRKR